MRLTDLTVKNLSVERGQRTFFDDTMPGFGVRVSPKSRTFVLVIHRRGKNKWETLGKYPVVSLSKAREEARNRLSTVQLRKGPEMPVMAFTEAYELFLASYKAKNRPKTVYEMERVVRRHLTPKFGHSLIAEISTHELATLIERLMPTPAECLATFKAARTIFRWAARRRILERSPLEGVEPPVKIAHRTRVLNDDELRIVWNTSNSLGNLNPEFATIVKLLILTGQREGQIAKLRGEWIDRDAKTITWPAEAMKSGRPHILPLASMALATLQALPRSGFVFRARGKETPFSGFSACKASFDRRVVIPHWTLHDLRRTFSTDIAKLRVPPHIKEMLLAHSTAKDPIEAIYDLHTYEPEMRDALGAWEAKLTTLLVDRS